MKWYNKALAIGSFALIIGSPIILVEMTIGRDVREMQRNHQKLELQVKEAERLTKQFCDGVDNLGLASK